ncbi:MAG TPA: redoxin domain-containing protein [Candidatus Dormibacteraeota bacterium]|nr:redoxin domain-containing protein [Candidatus Dormibacteraeota bacterium]
MQRSLVGRPAPAFSLAASDGTVVALDDLRGAPLILVFFRGTW